MYHRLVDELLQIRKADQDDQGWLLLMLPAFNRASGFKTSLMPDQRRATEMLYDLIESQVFLVAERDGDIVGFVCGVISECPLNPEVLMFSELLWWVEKHWRGKCRAGSMLMDAAIAEAKQRGAKLIWWSTQDNTEVRPDSLLRRGFVAKEVKYLLEV